MPPKPWESKNRPPSTNISQIIASNPTPKDDVVKLPTSGIMQNQANSLNKTSVNGTTTTTGLTNNSMNSYGMNNYGGYGSSYGGYGSSYGGYGSSYGGYGGYGGYGSYGGYGGYGMGMGMGRYGMMNGMQQQGSFLNHTLMTLQRFGYLINILCQIARSFDQNYQGLHLFVNSFKNLGHKISSGTQNGFKWIFGKIFGLFKMLFQFIKYHIFFMRKQKSQEKYKSVTRVLQVFVILFAISLYPLLRKGMKVA